jgi:hypothetical protein
LHSLYCKTCKFDKLYQFTCLTVQAVQMYMSYSTSCTHLHVFQYKLCKFTCLTVQAVQIYMSYSTSCTHLHVLQYKLYIFTCLTVQAVHIYLSYSTSCTHICTACTVRHVHFYSFNGRTCKFVQLVL